jgi:hypothetical protein
VLALRRGLDNAERTVPDRVCKVSIIVLSIPVGTLGKGAGRMGNGTYPGMSTTSSLCQG